MTAPKIRYTQLEWHAVLLAVLASTNAPIAINGSAVSIALATPGRNARLPFTGTNGSAGNCHRNSYQRVLGLSLGSGNPEGE